MSIAAREHYLATAKRLRRHITMLGSAHPNIWRRVDEVRAACSRGSAAGPSWCYLSGCAVTALAREYPGIAKRISLFEGLAAWRLSQGIYIFDPLLISELSRTVESQPIPGNLLLRIPEWCIYIMATEGPLTNWGLNGALAFLSYDETRHETALRLLLNMADDDVYATFPVWLNNGSVQQSAERAAREAGRVLARAGRSAEFGELCSLDIGQLSRVMAALVNLVLYVCSEKADIVDLNNHRTTPSRPIVTKTRKRPRMFPPDEVALWEVGFRVGNAIRRASAQTERLASERNGVRPHFRRAHWHSFWTGSRSDPDSRVLRVKWIHPVLVRAQEVDDGGNLPIVRIIQPTRAPQSPATSRGFARNEREDRTKSLSNSS